MFAILIRSAQPILSPAERLLWLDEEIKSRGYRAPTINDVQPGAKCIRVHIDEFCNNFRNFGFGGIVEGCTTIRLEEQPVRSLGNNQLVFFRCTMPVSHEICTIALIDFLTTGYVEDLKSKPWRFIVKI